MTPFWIWISMISVVQTSERGSIHDELFGSGMSDDFVSSHSKRYASSSVEDLKELFHLETRILRELELTSSSLDSYYNLTLSDIENVSEYVSNPINAFHLMKRTSTKLFEMSNNNDNKSLPDKKDFRIGAALGLANLQRFYELDVRDMMNGILKDPIKSGISYKALHVLDDEDAFIISKAAAKMKRFNSQVIWLRGALYAAVRDGKSKSRIKRWKQKIELAESYHDDLFVRGFYRDTYYEDLITLNPTTFNESLQNTIGYKRQKEYWNRMKNEVRMFENQAVYGTGIRDSIENHLTFKIMSIMEPITYKLCQGKQIRPAYLDKDLKCRYHHRGDPYLRLGPIKLEIVNQEPMVGIFHDFVTDIEMESFKTTAKGKMTSTPLVASGSKEMDYTPERTSKVMYLNERFYDIPRKVSDRLSHATKFNLYHSRFDSENYQVMNYGMGGTIVTHLDSNGFTDNPFHSEHLDTGGPRIMTIMLYLSDVEAGGRTVFNTAGVSVTPIKGNVLFWFNIRSDGHFDSRNHHCGCPVMKGNKWIANKWVKWTSQAEDYPCYVDKTPYSL